MKYADAADEPITESAPVHAKATSQAIEAWGEQKGMWPQQALPGSAAARDYWKFAAAKTWCKWADGQLVTEAEFDKGVADATSQTQR
jgi:hypothetical protein